MNTNENPNSQLPTSNFSLVYAYTRAQAVADGVQVEVTKVAQQAGIRFPMFLTRAVYDAYVAVPLETLPSAARPIALLACESTTSRSGRMSKKN